MLTGRSFKLGVSTLAIADVDGKRKSVTIPAGSILKVVADGSDSPNAFVGVLVDGRIVEMFAQDIRTRGAEMSGDAAL